jgi:hypothetical protein
MSTERALCVTPQASPAETFALHDLDGLRPVTRNDASSPDWLNEINRYREAAGLSPVTEQPAWEAGLQHHLIYLEKTPQQYFTGPYASWHTENPASPYYTQDGALEAGYTDILSGGATTEVAAIDVWLVAPFHAIGMLRSHLTQVELGFDQLHVADLDVIQGLDYSSPAATTPVLFPGPGITTNLARYGGEAPNPLETLGWQQLPEVGLPLIALLPQAPDPGLTASLARPNGPPETSANGDLGIVDEDTYVSSDPIYGPTGLAILKGDNAVLLIPRHPLANGAYSVRIQQPNQPDIAWSFSVYVPDTIAPTISASGAADGAWLNHATTITLTATDDPGGSGVASIAYTLDGVAHTVAGSSAQVALPASPNGAHTLSYHASDLAGNVSADQRLELHIDTIGPTTLAKPAKGRKGKAITLKCLVADNLSPQAKAVTMTIRNSHKKVVKTFKLGTKNVATWCAVKWTPKAKGSYRYTVTAKDLAGNTQSKAGSAQITVK